MTGVAAGLGLLDPGRDRLIGRGREAFDNAFTRRDQRNTDVLLRHVAHIPLRLQERFRVELPFGI
jgi:hypothetical protein